MVRTGEICCMCGDCGVSSELFTCKNCGFRSQHKYCSNLYPEAESYDTCNWCLSQIKDVKKSTTDAGGANNTKTYHPNSSSSSSHSQNGTQVINKLGIKKSNGDEFRIKKQSKLSTDRFDGGKRVVGSDGGIDKIRIITRTRSEEIANSGGGIVIKQVFRNKVRRYKLLDEVSS